MPCAMAVHSKALKEPEKRGNRKPGAVGGLLTSAHGKLSCPEKTPPAETL